MSNVLRSDAGRLPLADNTVDLIVTSPPYFGLRSYTDGGEHYTGQVGDEDTPTAYLDRLIRCTAEWMRVLKPSGSIFVNLGDKYAADNRGSGGDVKRGAAKWAPAGSAGYAGQGYVRQKSLMMLPARYAIRCVDELGLIQRAEIIWSKPNGLPESVTDRVRRSHEQVFHFTKEPRYFAGVDEIRESYAPGTAKRYAAGYNARKVDEQRTTVNTKLGGDTFDENALGKLPGSVWTIPTAPLTVPASLGVDHFAAFPPELVRRIVLGWSPREVCTACGQGRRPVTDIAARPPNDALALSTRARTSTATGTHVGSTLGYGAVTAERTIVGYACACPDVSAAVTPGVCLDPFGGTGTTALVADCYGRVGISVDLSHDYSRLARWRTTDPGERARVLHVEKPPTQVDGQIDLFGDNPTQGEDEL